MKTENKNFLYNIIYQLLTFIIPFITVPYVSRVLGVNNVGIYSYTYSIVYLFMLTGMLGFNNYGSRVIASCKDDKEKLSIQFSSIYTLQIIVNILVLIAYCCYLVFFCKDYLSISILQGLFLLSICLDINWFFFGIEKFKLTVIRNLIIKFTSIILVFIFVKSSNDLWIYTIIMGGSTLLSQLYLVIIVHKYVRFRLVPPKEITKHIKEVLILFVPVIAFSVYRVMDKTMIGSFSTVDEVAYYEYAEKIMNIPSAVISALGTVMLPRMSYLYSNKKSDARIVIDQSMKLALKCAAIMFFGILLVADETVLVLFGNEFHKSTYILNFLSVTILASAWANVVRTHFLIPLKKDKIYLNSTILAAAVNLILNLFFIRKFGALGACIGTIAAEFFVMFYQVYYTKKDLNHLGYLKILLKELFVDALIIFAAYILSNLIENMLLRLIFKVSFVAIIFVIINRKFILNEFFGKK
ncbi:MAG: flippase [Longibaculum sp.]